MQHRLSWEAERGAVVSVGTRRHRLELVAAGARLAAAGLMLPGEGNLSARLAGGGLLITPAGADKGRLRAVELVTVPVGDELAPHAASMEATLHRELYDRHPSVMAVVHAHPPGVQALAGRGIVPDLSLLLEAGPILGGVAQVGPLSPGSRELAMTVARACAGATACVLERHGAVAIGPTVKLAVLRMLLLERLAQLTLEASR